MGDVEGSTTKPSKLNLKALRQLWREQHDQARQHRPQTRWFLAGIGLLTLWSHTGNILTVPLLARRQYLLLVVFNPRPPFLVAAAHDGRPLLVIVVGILRSMAGDPLHFVLGRRYGPVFVSDRVQRWLQRLGLPLVALWPRDMTMWATGAASMSFWRVMLVAVLATAVQITLIVLVGSSLLSLLFG